MKGIRPAAGEIARLQGVADHYIVRPPRKSAKAKRKAIGHMERWRPTPVKSAKCGSPYELEPVKRCAPCFDLSIGVGWEEAPRCQF